MRVAWFCNMLLPEIAKGINMKTIPFGGWLSGALDGLRKVDDIQITVCCPCDRVGEIESGRTMNIDYILYPVSNRVQKQRYGSIKRMFEIILDSIFPDILHIWGTEYDNAKVILEAQKNTRIPAVVSIQGICSKYIFHYYAGLPEYVCHRYTLRDAVKIDNLQHQYRVFLKIAQQEELTLELSNHVIGRTLWDKASISQINPTAKYHFCNEILRPSFYKNRWSITKCEKHTIFISQWSSPLKGFHYAIEAINMLTEKYEDLRLITTGKSPFEIPFYRLTSYQKYIVELIRKYNLKDRIIFTGVLDEEEMCKRYLKSHIFVQNSTIENSPNSVGEAMLLGMPVVASYVGGTMDMLKDKEEGFLFQADAPYMMAYYIEQIFEDEELAVRIGEKAHEHAMTTHDPHRNTLRLIDIYKGVIENESK